MILPEHYSFLEFDYIDSSNEEAKRLIKTGAIHNNTVILAHSQSAGHGRHGRVWQSPVGNLYCSLIIKVTDHVQDMAQISFVAATSVGGVLAEILPKKEEVQYKWPNDVLVNGKKISGILLEFITDCSLDDDKWLIVGIGVNVETLPENTDRPVTSLRMCGANDISPQELLSKLVYFFNKSLNLWKKTGFTTIRNDWMSRAWKIGEEITVNLSNETFSGIFKKINEKGELEILVDGQKRLISSGEVFFK